MESRITVIGSANNDLIVNVPHLPAPGETILGGTFFTSQGGKGANQAVAASRAGGQVEFIARIGLDAFGTAMVSGWAQDGLGLRHLVRDPEAPSGVALIFVDQAGENCIAVAPGANANLSVADLDRAAAGVAWASVVLLQLEIPLATVLHAARQARQAGAKVLLNPAPVCPLGDDLLEHVSILTPNRTEAEGLTGVTIRDDASARQAALLLLDRGPEAVIITLGSGGAYVATPGDQRRLPAFAVTAVDTVAAGDVFNGALAVAVAEGQDLVQAVRFASAAAAIAVTRRGAQASAPHRGEIETLLATSTH